MAKEDPLPHMERELLQSSVVVDIECLDSFPWQPSSLYEALLTEEDNVVDSGATSCKALGSFVALGAARWLPPLWQLGFE